MAEFVVVYVTVGSADEGKRIAEALVEERLAACVNQLPGIRSVYRWQGKVETSSEELLLIKTAKELIEPLTRRVRELHSYALPEVIAAAVIGGSEPYLQWLHEQVSQGGN